MKIELLPSDPGFTIYDQRIGELLIESYLSTYAKKMPEVVLTERRLNDLRSVAQKRADGALFILMNEPFKATSDLIGTVTLYPPSYSATEAWLSNHADLRYFVIDPKNHGQNLSKLLIETCIEQAKKWKCEGICIHVRRGAHGLARMYEKFGFKRKPEGDLDFLPEIFLLGYSLSLK